MQRTSLTDATTVLVLALCCLLGSGCTSSSGAGAWLADLRQDDAPASISGTVHVAKLARGLESSVVVMLDPVLPPPETRFEAFQRNTASLYDQVASSARVLLSRWGVGRLAIPVANGSLARPAVARPDHHLVFSNADEIQHEFFSLGDPNEFRITLPAGARSSSVALAKPGYLLIFCALHPEESAGLLVTRAHRFVVAERSGRFAIEGLAAGVYRLSAEGPQLASRVQRIELEAGQVLKARIDLEPSM